MLRVYNFETFGNSPYTTESAKQGEQRSMVSSNIRLRPSVERIQTTPPPSPVPILFTATFLKLYIVSSFRVLIEVFIKLRKKNLK